MLHSSLLLFILSTFVPHTVLPRGGCPVGKMHFVSKLQTQMSHQTKSQSRNREVYPIHPIRCSTECSAFPQIKLWWWYGHGWGNLLGAQDVRFVLKLQQYLPNRHKNAAAIFSMDTVS